MDYFSLLGLEVKYALDPKELERKYISALVSAHPDSADMMEEKQEKTILSAEINKGYGILKDDVARAEYILSLNGFVIDESCGSNIKGADLEKIIEEREFLEETEDFKELNIFLGRKQKEKENIIINLGDSFFNKKFSEAVDITIKLKYLSKLMEEIKTKIKKC